MRHTGYPRLKEFCWITTLLILSVSLQAQGGAGAASKSCKEGSEPVTLKFPGAISEWNGYTRYDFEHEGRNATVVVPVTPAKGNPWIVRPAFFGAFAQADSALLGKGFYVAYFDVTNFFGSPRAQALFTGFYDYMVETWRFSPKVTLEGVSRGGLFVLNWAANNPEKVACIYVDAPVCDVKSWPGHNWPDDWNDFLKEYHVTDAQADTLKCNPLDRTELLAGSKIPILCVCGDADKVVPYAENALKLRNQLAADGGSMRIITKPGCDHHPHSLADPTPIVDFVVRHQPEYQAMHHLNIRGNLNNSRTVFEKEKAGRVAFLGGSITEMKGWHNRVMEQLKQRFPDTRFEFIEAGISSTGTTPGAFRMERDVLSKGKVDLLFVEAAVNDHTNGFDSIAQIRGMEGEIRQALLRNPNMDIVMQHFIYDPFIPILAECKTPDVILNHEKVADYYQIPSINQAQEIAERMRAGEFDWEQFGGTHPAPLGQELYAAAIESLFDAMWSASYPDMQVRPHRIPAAPLDKYSYFGGKLVDPREARVKKEWKFESPWKPKEEAEVRDRYSQAGILEALTPGAELTFKFTGSAIGIYCLSGPDAGIVEYSIDGGKFKSYDLFTSWSKYLYIPWFHMFETELKNTKHKITLRMTAKKNKESNGHACQIYYFAVNGK